MKKNMAQYYIDVLSDTLNCQELSNKTRYEMAYRFGQQNKQNKMLRNRIKLIKALASNIKYN